ncbi:PP2C family protein-serine/threonine phosphatase [Streptomyces sp. enrichment culture]|uniref:PP2C family protein-serine/threonine phosphatase n=1 Tax=Streptomyces sp. enrichment culture TaxID=1795815 RepID=UPI003F55EEA6
MAAYEDPARILTALTRASHLSTFEDLPALVAAHATRAGLGRVGIFLADLQQDVLRELTGRGLDAGHGGEELRIDATLAGRAFQQGLGGAVSDGRGRHWVPILDGTERLGVLRVDAVPAGGADGKAREDLASLLGLLLVSKRAYSDSYARLTRTRPMSPSAEMQWTLMPPQVFSNGRVTIAAAMEPAYETAGDAFDYALAGQTVHLALFDAMGHDTAAGLTANLAVATCRSHRRRGAGLAETGTVIEAALMEQFHRARYATGVIADLDLDTGHLSWVNYGHPPPVLIRGGRWTTILKCPPTHPLGTDLGLTPTVCREQLEPGDRLLFHTDGITEARDAKGRMFGLDRFVDFLVRHHADEVSLPETLRRLVHSVLDYHDGVLDDDATVLCCAWHGLGSQRTAV